MKGQFSTAGLARVCARRAWIVVGLWVVAVALAGFSAVMFSDKLSDEDEFISEPESVQAEQLIRERMPRNLDANEGGELETIIIRSETATVDDAAFQAVVEGISADLRAMSGVVRDAPTYYEAVAEGHELAPMLVSEDRKTTIIPATISWWEYDWFRQRMDVLKLEYGREGIEILSISELAIDRDFDRLLEEDLIKAEIFGLPTALLVLVVVFGSIVAAGVPLVLALVSMGVAIGLTALIGNFTTMSTYALNMISMIGLAVGIDYALFIVERYREERRRDVPAVEAIGIAGGTASKAVLFSGITVVLALSGMFMLPTTLFRGLGAGAVLVVIVAVVASLTLVPAMLRLLGARIDWPRRRHYDAATVAAQAQYDQETIHAGFWGRITRVVMAHPVVSVVLASAVLVAVSLPYFDMQRGTAGGESLPDGDIKRAYQILETDFSAGMIDPVGIVVDARRTPAVEGAIDQLVAALAKDDAFGQVTDRVWNPDGTLAVVELPLRADANDPISYAAIERLRETLIPAAFAGVTAEALVTGDAASNLDFNTLVDDGTPIVFAYVLGLSFLLLLLAFRSIIVPLKAIVMNLLSVGASYGLLVLVFQKGYGVDLFGFQRTPTIEAWVPIFLFCILFGLSMDYHVFLLSRIREHYDRTGENRASVAAGLQSTARLITGAAAIMVVVFSGFASGSLVMFQQIGFGLGVAVLLDATIVRSILVPASMALLGNMNWYLPCWLAWLPDLRVEGGPAAHAPVVETAGSD